MTLVDVSIDPGFGKQGALGWGAFSADTERLVHAGLVRRDACWTTGTMGVEAAVTIARTLSPLRIRSVRVERMQVMAFARQIGDQNDLIALSEVGGICAGVLVGMLGVATVKIDYITPKDWKGQVPPDEFTKRIQKELERYPEEARVAEAACRRDAPRAKSIWHNLYDGVGIGLHRLGRVGRV